MTPEKEPNSPPALDTSSTEPEPKVSPWTWRNGGDAGEPVWISLAWIIIPALVAGLLVFAMLSVG